MDTKEKKFGISKMSFYKLIAFLSKQEKIEKAILYGSRAKGNFTEGSDIDITVIAPEMTFSEYLGLLAQVDEMDISQKIDLTMYEFLGENVKEHIKRAGIEIYSKI